MHVVLIGAELEENLAVRYLRGSLEHAGHTVTQLVFDEPEDTERVAAALAASGAPLAGMSMVFTRRASEFAELATRARELGFRGHLTCGGHFASFNAEALLRDVPAIDSVVTGEGEAILLALAEALPSPGGVRGLVVRAEDGAIARTPPAAKPTDLDALPWPTRKLPYDRYLGIPIVNLLGSRGCAHHCAFCSIAAWHRMGGGARLRMRSPASIAEEMAALYDDGVRIFNFHDDNFLLPNRKLTLERLDRLEAELAARGVGRIAFAIKARPDEVDTELFARLKAMGLFRVFLGVEAGSAQALLALGRGQALADNERALAIVNELDLHACFNLLLWNPDSTLEDVAVNVAFLRKHPRNPMNFCRTEIYAGTPLEARLRERGALLGDYWGYDYTITDPRAQQAFEIAFAAFEERNFGIDGLHHVAMRVDYELQLLGHFGSVDERLRRRVKTFLVEVNLDTCAHLEAILAAVRLGRGLDRFLPDICARVAVRNVRLAEKARELLDDLHEAAPPRGARSAWAQRAAAASLAATLSLGTPGCPGDSRDVTHPTEMAPVPAQPVPGTKLVPGTPQQPPPVLVPDPGPPQGDPAAIRPTFDATVLRELAERLRPSRDVTVELTLDAQGGVADASLVAEGLTDALRARLVERMRRETFAGANVVGRRFRFVVTAAELDAARPRPTHMSERAPRPTHPTEMAAPPTHPREMAPRPPPFEAEMAPKPSGKRGLK